MRGLRTFFLHREYTKIAGPGNKTGEIRDMIDWEKFCPVISEMDGENKEIMKSNRKILILCPVRNTMDPKLRSSAKNSRSKMQLLQKIPAIERNNYRLIHAIW
jgi:hypothetical protein